jgi:hypothetical protein
MGMRCVETPLLYNNKKQANPRRHNNKKQASAVSDPVAYHSIPARDNTGVALGHGW